MKSLLYQSICAGQRLAVDSDPFLVPPSDCHLLPIQQQQHIENDTFVFNEGNKESISQLLENVLSSNTCTTNRILLERCYELTKPLPPIFDGNISSVLNSVTVPTTLPMAESSEGEENSGNDDNSGEKRQKITGHAKPKHCINLSEYLTLPQNDAAKLLGMATSSLSKKWKEASSSRKWPYRSIQKIDKEIMTLLNNISPMHPLDPTVENTLGSLLRRRQQELRPVLIAK